jgi:hypothetical protein
MELVAIIRVLWARRILVGVGIIVAVAAGVLAGRKADAGATSGGGAASMSLMLDTTDSQLVEAAPWESSDLPDRAFLLADVLPRDAAVGSVAHRAGVPVGQLLILTPAARNLPQVDSPLVAPTYQLESTAAAPYTVNVFADKTTPIVKLVTQAPDVASAARVTRAVAATLHSLAVHDDGHGEHGFVLRTVASLRTKALPAPSPHAQVLMVAGALATFVFWCTGVVLAHALVRRVRRPGGVPA